MKYRAKAHVFHLLCNFWLPSTSKTEHWGSWPILHLSILLARKLELASEPGTGLQRWSKIGLAQEVLHKRHFPLSQPSRLHQMMFVARHSVCRIPCQTASHTLLGRSLHLLFASSGHCPCSPPRHLQCISPYKKPAHIRRILLFLYVRVHAPPPCGRAHFVFCFFPTICASPLGKTPPPQFHIALTLISVLWPLRLQLDPEFQAVLRYRAMPYAEPCPEEVWCSISAPCR